MTSRTARWTRRLAGGLLACVGCPAPTFTVSDPSTTTATTSSTPSASTTTASTTAATSVASSTGASASSTGGCAADGTGQVPEDWWNPAWTQRRRVTIDTSIVPAGESVEGFPVLVHVPSSTPAEACNQGDGGHDLRFRSVASDEALLFDIDGWDPEGDLLVWLRVPVLDATAEPFEAWMYYGNPQADPGESPADLWGNYISVHHLGAALEDSASTHHGTSSWEPSLCDDPSDIDDPGSCIPAIGCARSFDSDLLHDVVLEGQSAYNFGDGPGGVGGDKPDLGVSLWMNSLDFTEGSPLVAKGETAWEIGGILVDGVDRIAFLVECRQQPLNCVDPPDDCACDPANDDLSVTASDAVVSDGTWHHVAVTSTAGEMQGQPGLNLWIYVDGELASESFLLDYVGQNEQPLRFGHNIGMGRRYRGALDEVRIANRQLPAAWIAAEYATVTQDHVSLGEEQSLCP